MTSWILPDPDIFTIDMLVVGMIMVGMLSKGKIPPPHIEVEICDAGFGYTNRFCLAVRHRSQILGLGRGV